MNAAKSLLMWVAVAAAFLVVVGLLTMTGDKPPEDPAPLPAPAAPAK